ncbi:hypothetical protein AR687_14850 [Flavobacteriaceae bacterium CRH]|nr:hypothetical protein AR687_14850 [Flavobacteriaceae bacterium CRH]
MKHTIYILVLTLALLSCNGHNEKKVNNKTAVRPIKDTIKFHKLRKLFVVGDFNGEGKKDTIFQHNYSGVTKSEIINAPDPFQNEWDFVVEWFYKQESELYLALNKNNQEKLYLGEAHGLYFLINIGDNNADGKDEIAFVIDYLDFSRVNSCKIYSLCKGKWILLKQFGVLEGAFDFTPDSQKTPDFDIIKEYLEKQNGKWVYKDYLQDSYDTEEEVGKMKPLKLEKCK